MIGAIIGDIVGSRFEFNNLKSKDFNLFTDESRATDDSVMTVAVAKAIMETAKHGHGLSESSAYDGEFCTRLGEQTVKAMQDIGRRYPNCGYGGMFSRWIFCNDPEPYFSFGNGAAMRVSPAGFAARTEDEVKALSEAVTKVTHNHPEGLKGAEAAAMAVFLARSGRTKKEIRERLSAYYKLDFSIDGIRETYRFNESCQTTVPQAVEAFLESVSFEDAIRTAVSLGGDSDTLAAITGAVAEAYYGVPDAMREKALSYLDGDLRLICDEWLEFTGGEELGGKFRVLTKYIDGFSGGVPLGRWKLGADAIPYVAYDSAVEAFTDEVCRFSESHPEYGLANYPKILENNGLAPGDAALLRADAETFDDQGVLALILGVVRTERYSEGTLLDCLNSGTLVSWLKKLKK